MSSPQQGIVLPPDDYAAMEKAVRALEHASFAIRLAERAGQPVTRLMDALPSIVSRRFHGTVENAILKCLEVAIESMDGEVPDPSPSAWVPKVIAGVTGGLGGLFGALSLPVELPLTTMVMLRSIVEIAHSHGEDLTLLPTRLACLEVFALGSRRTGGNQAISYFATRAALARLTSDLASVVIQQTAVEASSVITARVVALISAQFGPAVAERLAATAVPIIGLLGGATINMVFMDHYQQLAHGHFIIRGLERRYGAAEIEAIYTRIAASMPRALNPPGRKPVGSPPAKA